MPSATVTSKGQVTIPKAIRDALGIEAGDRLSFVASDDGRVLVQVETVDVRSLRGMVRVDGPPVSLEAMQRAIEAGATE